LSGVAHPVALALAVEGRTTTRTAGAMLWTHFGISGPAALDMSRHWLRARLEGHTVALMANLRPRHSFETLDAEWTRRAREQPRSTLHGTLSRDLPASLATAVIDRLRLDGRQTLATVSRGDRRRLVHAIVAWPLPALDSRGYNYAEVTAGGIQLAEIDPASMESRRSAGLFAVGEVLDVDGRLGGFNFQWAWSTAFVAARAIAARLGSVSV
jgi:predicted Rossmann fold flavoprotein